MAELRAVAMWRASAGGVDNCVLVRDGSTRILRGQAGGEIAWLGRVYATYEVVSDASWTTTRVRVTAADAEGRWRRLALRRDPTGRWFGDDAELPEVSGCDVVDLGVTPATNTLAIGRLGLAVGESAEIDAAWVRFPDLTVARLPQRYTRKGEQAFRYESGDFGADLEVDDHGLVTRYADIWAR